MDDIELLVKMAVNGDKKCLEEVVTQIKDMVYNLALRMLWNPADAEDAMQDILIKVITNLGKFKGKSKFTTWVYRITSNHLINMNRTALEKQELSFDVFARGIEEGFIPKTPVCIPEVERGVLAEELKVSCTHAMLLCLNREDRIIYILSSMFGINSKDGGDILEIKPEAYRKRLSRIKEKMRVFMMDNCGLANSNNICRCNKRVEVAIENRRINPKGLIFAGKPASENRLVEICKKEMEEFDRAAAVFISNPFYLAPEAIIGGIKKIIDSDKYKILQG